MYLCPDYPLLWQVLRMRDELILAPAVLILNRKTD